MEKRTHLEKTFGKNEKKSELFWANGNIFGKTWKIYRISVSSRLQGSFKSFKLPLLLINVNFPDLRLLSDPVFFKQLDCNLKYWSCNNFCFFSNSLCRVFTSSCELIESLESAESGASKGPCFDEVRGGGGGGIFVGFGGIWGWITRTGDPPPDSVEGSARVTAPLRLSLAIARSGFAAPWYGPRGGFAQKYWLAHRARPEDQRIFTKKMWNFA